jgi:chromosomal replication initiator protein
MQTAIQTESPGARTDAGADPVAAVEGRGEKVRAMLKARLGEEIYASWFKSMEFESFDGRLIKVSVPVKFVRNWIQEHYSDHLLSCAKIEFASAERVEVVWRQPGVTAQRSADTRGTAAAGTAAAEGPAANGVQIGAASGSASAPLLRTSLPPASRTSAGGLEGSPLDPRYTFDTFVVGSSNRMAHAGATQVADTILSGAPGYNPLYIHSQVGLGKSHLLQAIAWDVKKRAPNAELLYLTAERFRYQFVEAVRSSDPSVFKERFRNINVLLIDDLEFLQGERTEQEFDHIINALLDGGKQVVVASARAPNHIERLNERMRSRLQRGLVTELQPLDHELRQRVLEKRVAEKKALDPSFNLSRDVIDLLASRLTENGRELEGAVTRLYATWQYMRTPISLDIAETVIRDLVQNLEPRRIKIEDILRIISRHYGVSKGDLLSQRRHRSIVWPRQIGMYLAKQLTARSLPEIGRRFGGRDHTTVLHAIRKIEGEISKNPRLEDELEELKKLLNH